MKKLLMSLVLLAPMVPAAHAAVLFNYDNVATTAARGDGPYTIGNLFQVGSSDLLVTQLGVMDVNSSDKTDGSDGFANSGTIKVGIWDETGTTLLKSANVSTSSTQGVDGYRYVTLDTALTLDAGTKYLIGAYIGSGIEFFLDDHPGSAFTASTSDITLLASQYAGGDAAPTLVGGTDTIVGRWAPANAVFTAVPEPSAALLGGLGLLALLRRRR